MIRRRKYLARSRKRIQARYKTKGGRNSDPAKLAWLRTLPCFLTDNYHNAAPSGPFYQFIAAIEVHHHRPRNCRATDRLTVPICAWHHRVGPLSIDRLSARGFARMWGIDFDALCDRYETLWQLQRGAPGGER